MPVAVDFVLPPGLALRRLWDAWDASLLRLRVLDMDAYRTAAYNEVWTLKWDPEGQI